MKNIDILTKTDVRDMIINEIRKADKLISRLDFKEIIKS